MKLKYFLTLFFVIILFTTCDLLVVNNPNSKPTYGDTGLPKNCRAIIQANIDGYRSKKYSADDAIHSIERNCGMHGSSW